MKNQTNRLFTESLLPEIHPVKNATRIRRYVLSQDETNGIDETYQHSTPPPGELAIGLQMITVDHSGQAKLAPTGGYAVYYVPEG